MPKYKPTEQDLYETIPCTQCGIDVIEPKIECKGFVVCSYMCKYILEDYFFWVEEWNKRWLEKWSDVN